MISMQISLSEAEAWMQSLHKGVMLQGSHYVT